MEEKTARQKLCLMGSLVMAGCLIWTSAESMSTVYEFLGATKVIPYIFALVLVSLAAFGLNRVHDVFDEEAYVQNRPFQLTTGLIIYLAALCVSLAASIHGMYYRASQTDMQAAEADAVYRDLSQLSPRAEAQIRRATDDFNNAVEAALTTAINEVVNAQNCGAGSRFHGHRRRLEQLLQGIPLEFVTPGAGVTCPPSPYSIGVFVRQVREAKNRLIEERRGAGRELTDALATSEFGAVLRGLEALKTSFGSADRLESEHLLRKAFALRIDLSQRLNRLSTVLRQPSGDDIVYPDTPPSYKIKKVNAFWGRALAALFDTDRTEIERDKLFWAAIFGAILELGFASFYYFGYLGKSHRD